MVANRLTMVLVMLALGLSVTMSTTAQEPARNAPQAEQEPDVDENIRYWTTSWKFSEIDVDQLNGRLEKIGLGIPIDMVGKVTVEFDVALPLNALNDAKKYRVAGQVHSTRLKLEQLVLEDFRSTIDLRQGVMSIKDIQGRMIDSQARNSGQNAGEGRVTGNASLELAPIGNVKASVELNSVAIQPLHALVMTVSKKFAQPLLGAVSGSIQFEAPLKQIKDIRQWNAKTDLQVANFSRGELTPLNIDASGITIVNGEIRAENLQVTSKASPELALTLRGHVELTNQQRFAIGLRANDLPLEVLVGLAGANPNQFVVGSIDLDAVAHGEMSQLKWDVKGRVASPSLRVAGVDLGLLEHSIQFDQNHFRLQPVTGEATVRDYLTIKQASADYEISKDRIDLSNIDASLFGGEVAGSVQVGLRDGGDSRIDLKWQKIAPTINAQLFSLADVTLSATTSGSIDWRTPHGDWNRIAEQSGRAEIQLNSIRVGETEIGNLDVSLANQVGDLQLKAIGEMFGGKVEIATRSRLTGDVGWGDLLQQPAQIDLSCDALRIDRMIVVLPRQFMSRDDYRQLRGTLFAKLEINRSLDSPIESTGSVRVEGLKLGPLLLARRFEAQARTRGKTVFIDRAAGEYADGRITARGQWRLDDGDGRLDITVDALDAAKSMQLVSAGLAEQVDGKLSGHFYVSGGELLQARGSVQVSDAVVAGLPIGDSHSGFRGTYSLQSDQWKADFSSIVGKVARGSFKGEANFKSSYRPSRFDLVSQWTFDRVDFGELIAQAGGGSSSYARGQIQGSMTLGGSAIAGVNDLRGQFDTELDGSQASAIPGLSQAQQYLGAVPLAGMRIDDGRANGTIAGGRVKFDEFVLNSETLKFWAEGSVVLASQKMEIDAVISTGSFETNQVAQRYLQTALLTYTTPLGFFLRVNQLLNNRTIYVDIRGTVSRPQLRLKPLATLRDEAVRYLLSEFLGINCGALGATNPLDLDS